jgi:DNA-binding IclR family transcriptional regulator
VAHEQCVVGTPDAEPTAMTSAARSAQRTSSGRALTLLDAFAGPRSLLGVSELAARAGVPKSTAHRLLATLVDSGYVRRVEGRYCLAEHAFALGNTLWACRPGGLRERAVPYMMELSQQTQGTVHLAILDGPGVLYLEKLFAHNATPCPTVVGSRRPVHCTALGKSMLAHTDEAQLGRYLSGDLRRFTMHTRVTVDALKRDLDQARKDRVAVESEEYRMGLTCVAAPIVDRETGVAVAALSVSTTPDRVRLRRFASEVLRAADALTERMSVGAGYVEAGRALR